MLSRTVRRRPLANGALATIAGLWLLTVAGACSTLPPAHYPAFADHDVVAWFVVPADGQLPLPQSRPDLVLQALHVHPAPHAETFPADGTRRFTYAPGTRVQVHCRCRVYGRDGAPPPPIATVFPGAVQVLTAPPPSP